VTLLCVPVVSLDPRDTTGTFLREQPMFITFEGPDGSGKSCQMPLLADFLRQTGYSVFTTREPGGTPIGEEIRKIISNLKHTDMLPRTEILLFQASRAQLVEKVILPHIHSSEIVLCDRYADSTLAYQGYGYQLNLDQLRNLINFATGGLKPDLTLLLDIDVEEGLRRRAKGGEWNRLDAYQLDFYQRVRRGYYTLVEAEPERWQIIDAGQPIEAVQSAIRAVVLKKLQASS
jgi:dTMP kinase